MVPLLATALRRAHVDAPVTTALRGLISGELPLDEWVARVRATVPPPAARDSALAPRRRPRAPPPGHRVAEATGLARRALGRRRRARKASTNSARRRRRALRGVTLPPCCSATWRTIARPEPRARPPARRSAAVEAVEQERQIGRLDPRPVVAHAHAVRADATPRPRRPAASAGRVVEQVVDRARQPLARPSSTAGSRRASKRTPGAWRRARVSASRDQVVQAHVLAVVPRLVAARELDQIGDEHPELVGLLLDVGQQPRALVRPAATPNRPAPRCSCAG